ncbi:MAG: hypothetical protein JJT89_17625 [Nitriliruptoraceae bacterium]|nr:hypothetical protein [Nitriliruptoraceae bacterium]
MEISGGTITATGEGSAAGIGGSLDGAGGPVSITGGTVTASGAADAAGIGGGGNGAGGTVQIGVGAVVIATGGHTAIGAGQHGPSFGSLTVAGVLHLPAGDLVLPSGSAVTIGATGRILGAPAGDLTVGADVVGDGHIANGGVIALDATHVTGDDVTVSGHHYAVAFEADTGGPDPDEVTVFAPSFDAGERTFPTAPTRDGDEVFIGWRTEAVGAGDAFTTTSVLPGDSADGTPVRVTAVAYWSLLELESGLSADEATITAGERTSFTPTLSDSNDDPYEGDPASWTIGDADGVVDATVDPDTGRITLTATRSGTYPLQLEVPTGDGALATTLTLHVVPAAPAVLHLDVAATTLTAGDVATITVTGSDGYANATGDLTARTTFTSDVATDVVVGNTITFPTASPHTITATHASGTTATMTFEISPAAVDDPGTPDPGDPEPGAPDPGAAWPDPTPGPSEPTPIAAPGPTAPGVRATPVPAATALATTGADPLGLLTTALLMALAGTLLLRRSDARHRRAG